MGPHTWMFMVCGLLWQANGASYMDVYGLWFLLAGLWGPHTWMVMVWSLMAGLWGLIHGCLWSVVSYGRLMGPHTWMFMVCGLLWQAYGASYMDVYGLWSLMAGLWGLIHGCLWSVVSYGGLMGPHTWMFMVSSGVNYHVEFKLVLM